jgi:CheY-like chemotaxis protein
VRQSGGFVTLASSVGVGTRLSIYLPPSAKPIEVLRTLDELREIPAARKGTVLVVEDDATVLALVIEMFDDLGFRVITASDAHGALEIIHRGEPIDLLFTDIVMPGGRTGVELAVEARDFLPNVKILLTSGYPGEALAHDHSIQSEWPVSLFVNLSWQFAYSIYSEDDRSRSREAPLGSALRAGAENHHLLLSPSVVAIESERGGSLRQNEW